MPELPREATLLPISIAILLMLSSAGPAAAGADSGHRLSGLRVAVTRRHAELRETLPVRKRPDSGLKPVLSARLPRLRRDAHVTFSGEVVLTTTCVEQINRCIGRSYSFDPHLEAQVVLAPRHGSGGKAEPVSRTIRLTCQQTRPNRNHHCPVVIGKGSFRVHRLADLPCRPDDCELRMIAGAWNRDASADQVVVVGSDQPDGSVDGGKARLSAAIASGRSDIHRTATSHLRTRKVPASFRSGKRVVYSQRLGNLRKGDVLLMRSRQVSRIRTFPYFVSSQIVMATRRAATRPSAISRRAVSRSGTVTETTGFNCTLGRSAFDSPCVGIKSGIVRVGRVPRSKTGKRKALYANLVTRGFPKLAQARGAYPPLRILDRGYLRVTRMRTTR
jgi:hypothetical protein